MPRAQSALRVLLVICLVLLVSSAALAEGAPATARSAVLLLKASSDQGTEASFGRGGTSARSARALREPFETAGFEFVSAKGVTPPVGDVPSDLPLSDAAALEMARQVGASLCVVVGLVANSKGKIRATKLVSHEARLRVRVLTVGTGEVVADLKARRFGYGPSASQSASSASTAVVTEVGKNLAPMLRKRWPVTSAGSATALSLTINGASGWRPIAAILTQLAASKGIKYVHTVEIGSSQVRLSVSSALSAASLVSILRRTRIANGALTVVASGNIITIRLRMSTPASPINNG